MRLNLIMSFLFLLFSLNLFSQTADNRDSALQIFEKVEIEASFPGGIEAWRNFLVTNLNPSVPVDNGAPNGLYTVIVQFIVNKEGRISDIKPLTNQGYGMEQEVVRIMKMSGLWNPALMNNKPVNAYRKQPVSFMTSTEGFDIFSKTPHTLFTNTENELTIQVDNQRSTNLEATISEGTIAKNENGKFIARVSKPGRAVITVYNKKKTKMLGEMSFEVRQPDSEINNR
jgi:hypothetical protein